MTRTKLAIAAAIGLVCMQPLTTQTVSAQAMGMTAMGGHAMDGMHGGSFLMLLKSANLTSAQQAQVRQILQSDQGQMRTLGQQLHALHEQIAEKLLGTGRVTDSDLKPLVQHLSSIQQNLSENMVDTALAIRGVLTPEQLNRLAQVHAQLQSLHSQIQSLMGSEPEGMAEPEN
ncbi:MAG TPA: periplasmic heavy metal sensor [Rhizomicrobium sp.]